MINLTDAQSLLLSTASRQDGSIYPLPAKLSSATAATKAVAALVKRGLVEERETSSSAVVHRTNGDLGFGMFVTAAGLVAIGIEGETGQGADEPAPTTPGPKVSSKRTAVIALLATDTGATMAELIAATAWLPHTTRAALTGLRKAGHVIERSKRDGDTCYRIVTSA